MITKICLGSDDAKKQETNASNGSAQRYIIARIFFKAHIHTKCAALTHCVQR